MDKATDLPGERRLVAPKDMPTGPGTAAVRDGRTKTLPAISEGGEDSPDGQKVGCVAMVISGFGGIMRRTRTRQRKSCSRPQRVAETKERACQSWENEDLDSTCR